MTDTYLRSLGFASTSPETSSSRAAFSQAWRYQHETQAQDGTRLFLEHPMGIDSCRLSALAAPLAAQDVFATVALHDEPALESAIKDFFAAHGGLGAPVPIFVPHQFRPYRRAL